MSALPLDQVIDICIDDITAGRRGVEDCIADYPEHAAELRPLLEAAFVVNALPRVPEQAPSAEQRAAFMAALATTPQQALPRSARSRLPRIRFHVPAFSFARLTAVAAPAAAAVAVVAVAALLLVGHSATPASASTLTVFAGTVQQESGGQWQPLADGASLKEGEHLRTTADGSAMITFPDGSTTTLAPSTELVLQQISVATVRDITLDQRTGRLWNDVVPDHRAGAAYIVRTPDAIAQAVGTVFETKIENGTTSVTTARGLVRVQSGNQQLQVADGEAVQLKPNTPAPTQAEKVKPEAQVSVDAPFAASLIAPDGAATGARPDGVTFNQVAGVATTNPGTGPQSIDVLHATPGDYTLLLRRFADGTGNVVIHTANGDITIPVDNGSDLKVGLRVSVVDGKPSVQVLKDAATTASAAVEERSVPKQRTEHAVGVAKQRADEAAHREHGAATGTAAAIAAASPTATPTETRRGDRRGRDGEGDATATATATATGSATPTATPGGTSIDAVRQQLELTVASGDAQAIRQTLTVVFGDGSPLSQSVQDTLLLALSTNPSTQANLQAFLSTDTSAIAQKVSAALGAIAPPTPSGGEGEPESGDDAGPQSRATSPSGEGEGGRDGGRRRRGGEGEGGFSLPGLSTPTPTPTPSAGSSLLPGPTATPTPALRDGGDESFGGDD